MKGIIVFCMFLTAIPVFAGTWRDDFENQQDFINDCQNGVWIEELDLATDIAAWENGSVKMDVNPGGGGMATGDNVWKDYTVECKIKQLKINRNGSGLLLRHPILKGINTYFFGIEENEAGIYRDFFSALDSFPFKLELGKWYYLKAVIQGNQLEFYLDGKLVAKAQDDVIPAGRVGLGSFGSALFDDFVMTGPEVKDGGHWNPKVHEQLSFVQSQGKIAETWGKIKNDNQ